MTSLHICGWDTEVGWRVINIPFNIPLFPVSAPEGESSNLCRVANGRFNFYKNNFARRIGNAKVFIPVLSFYPSAAKKRIRVMEGVWISGDNRLKNC